MDDSDDLPPSWEQAYPELKQIARARLHAGGGLTGLNTTALVSETFLRWGHRADRGAFPSKGHFFAYAARVMRSVVVDLVRERSALRRGGAERPLTLDTQLGEQLAAPDDDEVLQVNAALQQLQAVEPRLAEVVDMRYFAGMTETEIAQVLGVTERTIRRDWEKARALLRTMLAP